MTERPAWHELLRKLREAAGVTQAGWAARLGYSRRTVQRWEQGDAVPDSLAEEALLSACAELGLFQRLDQREAEQWSAAPAGLRASLAEARVSMPAAEAVPTAPSSPPTNLPAPLTQFIGREHELATVRRLLVATRLLTLTGPAGIGKSRLAVQMGAAVLGQYPDGVFLVSLMQVRDPALVSLAIAKALVLPESAGQSTLDSLCIALRDRHMLLILDNFEQVIEAAPLVVALLQACPRLQLIVTSRIVLHLSGEQEYNVPPLAVPDLPPMPVAEAVTRSEGLALFVARAQDVQPAFALSAEAVPTVTEICHRLDGLPLAIELAAARSKIFPPAALLARLEHPLPFLTGGARNLAPHQQTLRDTLAWSYQLLSPAEQTLFRRLAVFIGGCTLELAAEVCAGDGVSGGDVLDGLTSLVDKSLIVHGIGPAEEPRFSMLSIIHEFAGELLEESGEVESMHRLHAAALVRLAERAEAGLRSAGCLGWIERLAGERENLREAVRWATAHAEIELALGLVGGLELWFYFAAPSDGRRWTAAALQPPAATAPTVLRARALLSAGQLAYEQQDFAAMRRQLEESVAIFREHGDTQRMAFALVLLGMAMVTDYAAGTAILAEAAELMERLGHAWGSALVATGRGRLAAFCGEVATAQAQYAQSAALFRAVDDPFWVGINLDQLGLLALESGDDSLAERSFSGALRRDRSRPTRSTAQAVFGLGRVAERRGQWERAGRLLGSAEQIAASLGLSRAEALQAEYRRRSAQSSPGGSWSAAQGRASQTCTFSNEAVLLAAWEHGRTMLPEQAIELAQQAASGG